NLKAYFGRNATTQTGYLCLSQSTITNDIIQNVDVEDRKKTFVVTCTFTNKVTLYGQTALSPLIICNSLRKLQTEPYVKWNLLLCKHRSQFMLQVVNHPICANYIHNDMVLPSWTWGHIRLRVVRRCHPSEPNPHIVSRLMRDWGCKVL